MAQLKSDYEIVTIADFYQWFKAGTIELSAKYQRNKVWNENARSYLMDSIVRGFPIPPIFMRKRFDVDTSDTFREVIDGQQRLTAILDFLNDDLQILPSHNSEYSHKFYSSLTDQQKEEILSYKISSGIVVERKDSVIYEMFARLNSNNYMLNKQEIRNAVYWGPFKVFIYNEAAIYHDFFADNGVFGDKNFSRMDDALLMTSLSMYLLKGIVRETPKILDNIYLEYDNKFEESEAVSEQLKVTFQVIQYLFKKVSTSIYPFNKKNYFYTLFVVITEILKREDHLNNTVFSLQIFKVYPIINNFANILNELNVDEPNQLEPSRRKLLAAFKEYHVIHTTSADARKTRVEFLFRELIK